MFLGQVEITTSPVSGAYYQVQTGDTLSAIAKAAYGAASKYRWIFNSTWNQNNYFARYSKTADQLHKVGDPRRYPILWIPNAEGIEPSVAPPMQDPGTITERGPEGPPGPKGDPGRPPSASEIRNAVNQYMAENPVAASSISPAELEAAIAAYMERNPVSAAECSPEMIAAAVANYFKNNPPPAGERGPRGKRGARGEAGRPPTVDEVRAAVDAFMAENPVAAASIPMEDIEAAVSAYMDSHPMTSEGVSPEMIRDAVASYIEEHPIERGTPGERGPQGVPGRPPTVDEIRNAVNQYMAENPVSAASISPEDMEAAVSAYMDSHPMTSEGVSPEMIRDAVSSYMDEHPMPSITDEMLSKAVSSYMQTHPVEVDIPTDLLPSGRMETVGPLILWALAMAV